MTARFAAALLLVPTAFASAAEVEPGALPARWGGASDNCIEQPDWSVQEYNRDFYILRQSGCTHYEKPFLFLIFGAKTALLLDTGAGQRPGTAAILQSLLQRRKEFRKLSPPAEVLVLHSHGHGDHTAGDAELSLLPGFRVVPAKPEAIAAAFGIPQWPDTRTTVDLGDRTLDLIPIPGHEPASIALYDRRTAILLTGDSLYPGRIYIRDWPAFRQSIQRLVEFTSTRPVSHILGAHIEQSRTPFIDYPAGSVHQPQEHPLELPHGSLLEMHALLSSSPDKPVLVRARDFTLVPRK